MINIFLKSYMMNYQLNQEILLLCLLNYIILIIIYRVGHKYCYKIKYKHILKKAFISIFKFANIQDSYQQTISHKLYSKCFPLAFTTARSLLEKSLMEARTIFMGIFSHVFINFNFRASILGLSLEQASLSRIDHKK